MEVALAHNLSPVFMSLYYNTYISTIFLVLHDNQFGANTAKSTANSSGEPQPDNMQGPDKEGEPVPEDITTFYDKIDKEEEDEDEAVLKTVSFEVNQVPFN